MLAPHEVFAVPDTFPLVDPTVAVIEVVVDEPLQPDGNVQVYDVAPVTANML